MGAKTDEFEKVKEELDEAHDELRQGAWQRKAKAIAIVITALTALATAVLAHFRPETVAEQTAGAAAVQLRQLHVAVKQQDKALGAAQAVCQRVAAEGAAKAKAEADSARTLLLGFLLANKAPRGDAGDALAKVVKQLGENKTAAGLKPLLKAPPAPVQRKLNLAPPDRLEQLSKGEK